MDPVFIFVIVILIFSIVIHEVSHGYAANWLGDPTARLQGRLTLNPISHIDPLGSIIIPGLLVLTNAGLLFGWAKPVPYNPYNLRNQKWGEAIVAGAGPAVNILIALFFGLSIRFGGDMLSQGFLELASFVVYINILLAFFNMIPIPPLDGSKVLKSLLPYKAEMAFSRFEERLYQYGMIFMFVFLFAFIYLVWPIFRGLLAGAFTLITGQPAMI
jgi:Zn-dependent protease